ncbi:MAG: hypothetical protein M3Y58_03150 [Chloroflexota bacterium]|nr:hypothetical protein [Chloroflexota bacterium]
MRRGISPGALIGIVFLVVGALFAFIVVAAVKQQTPTSPTAPPVAVSSPAPVLPPPTIAVDALLKASGATTYSLDSLNDTSFATPPPMPIRIPNGTAITVRGWAVDVPNSAAAGGVILSVDTTNYVATYGVDRPDVATALGNAAYTKSGFTMIFPANTLASGRHTIAIKILTKDHTSYYQPDQKVEIEIGQPLEPLQQLNETTKYSIDSLNDTSFAQPPPAPIRVPANGTITLRGWAVDTRANRVAGGVIVSVDDTMDFQATYGVERQDVADVLGDPAYRLSGFNTTFSAAALAPGMHTIRIKILTNDRTSYYQPDQQIVIEIV